MGRPLTRLTFARRTDGMQYLWISRVGTSKKTATKEDLAPIDIAKHLPAIRAVLPHRVYTWRVVVATVKANRPDCMSTYVTISRIGLGERLSSGEPEYVVGNNEALEWWLRMVTMVQSQ